jgi:prepilin-type N-terminal cleavage/methylation domain-containing protein
LNSRPLKLAKESFVYYCSGSDQTARRHRVCVAQRRAYGAGFSLLELVVVIVIIALLATLALERLWAMRVDAERVAIEQTVGALRSALGIKVAAYLARGDVAALEALEGSNPMDRLSEVPENYLGALAGPDPASIEGGHWYFDTVSRRLVYRVHNEGYFSSGAGLPARAQFAVRRVFDEQNRLAGVRLEAFESYAWKIE